MIDIESLDATYERYGYKKANTVSSICLYLYEEGRYFGADIIPIKHDDDTIRQIELLRKEYAENGYAAKIKNVNNVAEAADELYKSFFSYKTTISRLRAKYKNFEKNQSRLSGGAQYSYIHSPYQINNNSPTSSSIIQDIHSLWSEKKPQLIIIEAAAGYGKTCTSYEILKTLTENNTCDNPIITELSRNRGANIFRYILLDEIDREYPTLDSKLVKHEIHNGRIPLIIDGFDELLNKSELVSNQESEVFGEVEPMLDTIGKMLDGRAKIILTTRKTAIFGGAEFRDWFQKWDDSFSVTRFSIEIPRIKDWLGKDRTELIKSKNVPIQQVANPVLLTYLKNLNDQEFSNHLEEPDLIVRKYYYSLMEREKTRQELFIDPEDQYNIFKKLASMMIQFDLSSEKKQFIKDLIEEENREILEKALKSYPGKLTIETLTDKLVNHAILDRKGREENMVGFINEFVFGSFIGELMCESTPEQIEKDFSAYMVEIGATAYRVQNHKNKELLWSKIDSLKQNFPPNILFNFDITLKGKLLRPIKNTTIQSSQVYSIDFLDEPKIESSVFINCKFKNCKFNPSAFSAVTFIQCEFDSCTVKGYENYLDKGSDITALKCIQNGCDIFYYNSSHYENEEYNPNEIFQNDILEKVLDYEKRGKSQKLTLLINSYPKAGHKKVKHEVDMMEKHGILKISGLDVYVTMNRIKEIEERIKKAKN